MAGGTNLKVSLTSGLKQRISSQLVHCRAIGDMKAVERLQCVLVLDKLSPQEAARVMGVRETTMVSWMGKLIAGGVRALVSKVRRGRTPSLDKAQRQVLRDIILAGPEAAGLAFSCWTLSAIQDVVFREFGIALSLAQISRVLHKKGVVWKKGSFRLSAASPEERAAWLTTRFPALVKAASKEKAALLFGDEVGFAPGRAPGYTWGLRGAKVLVRHPGKNFHTKAFGAIDIINQSFCYHVSDRANKRTFKDFLRIIARKYRNQKVYLILDNVAYHKSGDRECKAMGWKIEIVYLPSYSPDFNPIEQLWKVMKGRYIKNFEATTARMLKKQVLTTFRSVQHSFLSFSGCYKKWAKVATLTSTRQNLFTLTTRKLTEIMNTLKDGCLLWATAA